MRYTEELYGRKPSRATGLHADLRDKFDNCNICEGEADCVLAYLVLDSDKEVNKAYTASGMSNNIHVSLGTRLPDDNVLIQSFFTKNVLQVTHDVVTRASQRTNDKKLDFSTRFLRLQDNVVT